MFRGMKGGDPKPENEAPLFCGSGSDLLSADVWGS